MNKDRRGSSVQRGGRRNLEWKGLVKSLYTKVNHKLEISDNDNYNKCNNDNDYTDDDDVNNNSYEYNSYNKKKTVIPI